MSISEQSRLNERENPATSRRSEGESGAINLDYWERLFSAMQMDEEGRQFLEDARKLFQSKDVDDELVARYLWHGLVSCGLRSAILLEQEQAQKEAHIGLRLPPELLKHVDKAVAAGLAESRSEFIRNLVQLFVTATTDETRPYLGAMAAVFARFAQNPAEVLLYSVLCALLGRPETQDMAKLIISIRDPLIQIISTLTGKPLEEIEAMGARLFETQEQQGKEAHSEDSTHAPDQHQ